MRTNRSAAARVRLLTVPDCPLADRARAEIDQALTALTGATESVEELVGPYPSPTVLVDGIDVVTGDPPATGACCRLDLPDAAQIVAALTHTDDRHDHDPVPDGDRTGAARQQG